MPFIEQSIFFLIKRAILFIPLQYFYISLLFFNFENYFYNLDKFFIKYVICKYFPWVCDLSFHLLDVSFESTSSYILVKSNLSFYIF